MNMDINALNTPLFIPKVDSKSIEKYGIHFPILSLSAHHLMWHPNCIDTVKECCDSLIIDPATHRLMYNSRTTSSYKKLPYSEAIEPEEIYSNYEIRKAKLIKPVVDFQLNHGAGCIIPPYFLAEDTDDIKFKVNINLLTETVDFLREASIDIPIVPVIAISNNALNRQLIVTHIVNSYTTDIEDVVDAFIVKVSNLDHSRVDPTDQMGFAHLVFQLGGVKPVFVKRVGSFGEILSAVGSSGTICGITGAESFSTGILNKSKDDKFKKSTKRYFVPEIMAYVNEELVKQINYKCSCEFCSGKLLLSNSDKELHLLHSKLESYNKLQEISPEKRVDYMIGKLNNGIKFIKENMSKVSVDLSPMPIQHLQNWKTILEEAKNWEYIAETDEELNAFLEDLDKE